MVGLSQAIHQRNYQRARSRALVRLAQAHRDHYKELLEEEREKDEQMGKTWVGIDTNTGSPITIESYKDAIEGATDTYYGGEDEGDDGGEA